jgi:flagellar basal body L-ring protein FlgH
MKYEDWLCFYVNENIKYCVTNNKVKSKNLTMVQSRRIVLFHGLRPSSFGDILTVTGRSTLTQLYTIGNAHDVGAALPIASN